MPSRPYLRGDEELYLQDGALIAHVAPQRNMHDLLVPGSVQVLTTDKRYCLGHILLCPDGRQLGCVWGDDRRDRRHNLTSVAETIRACREVYGPRPRYAIKPPD